MAEVILGMPGQWAHDHREVADHYTSKIGGLPDWPDFDLAVSEDLLLCAVCGGELVLVAQIYAPVSGSTRSTDERVIYVLGCIKECGCNPHSWKVLRVQKCNQDKEVEPEEESTSVVQDEPRSNGCPYTECSDEEESDDSDSDIDLDDLARALEKATTLASHSNKQHRIKCTNKSSVGKKMIYDSTSPVLPCFYIYSEKGSSKGKISKSISDDCSSSLKEIEKSNSANESEGEEIWEGEEYEHDKALGADRTYLKFKKQLDENPEQCFRYSYGGNPLIPVSNVPKPRKCDICGTNRRFEVQLMPPLLYFLHEAIDGSSDTSLDGWTWLTIIICTCPKSCCSQTAGEEAGSSGWAIIEEEAIVINDD